MLKYYTQEYDDMRMGFLEGSLNYIFQLVQDNSVIFPSVAFSDFEGKNMYITFDESFLLKPIDFTNRIRLIMGMFQARFTITYFMRPDKRFGDLQFLHIFFEDGFFNILFVYDISSAIEPVLLYSNKTVMGDEEGCLLHILKEPIGKN